MTVWRFVGDMARRSPADLTAGVAGVAAAAELATAEMADMAATAAVGEGETEAASGSTAAVAEGTVGADINMAEVTPAVSSTSSLVAREAAVSAREEAMAAREEAMVAREEAMAASKEAEAAADDVAVVAAVTSEAEAAHTPLAADDPSAAESTPAAADANAGANAGALAAERADDSTSAGATPAANEREEVAAEEPALSSLHGGDDGEKGSGVAHTQGASDWGWGDALSTDEGNEENKEEREVRAGDEGALGSGVAGEGAATAALAATAAPAAAAAPVVAAAPGPAVPQMWFKVDGGPPLVRNVLIHKGWLELETPEGATSPPRTVSGASATSPTSLPPQPPPPQHPPTGSPAVCAAIAALNLNVDTPPGQPFSPRKAPAEKHAEVYKANGWHMSWRSGRFKPSEYTSAGRLKGAQRLNHFPKSGAITRKVSHLVVRDSPHTTTPYHTSPHLTPPHSTLVIVITRKDTLMRHIRKMRKIHGAVS